MSGETEKEISGWTVDTLHSMILRLLTEADRRYDARLVAQELIFTNGLISAERAVTLALSSAERAVSKAEAAAEKRFDGVNEFRGTLSDQASRMITRAETESRLAAIVDNLNKLEVQAQGHVRRDDLRPLNEAINHLRDTAANAGGKSAALSGVITLGIAALAIVVTLVIGVLNRPAPASQTSGDVVNELRVNRETLRALLAPQPQPR